MIATPLATGGLAAQAQTAPGSGAGAAVAVPPPEAGLGPEMPPPDKSGCNLFHPVPENMLRALSPDRPDKTDSPFTVDAGHYQLELDFANFTSDAPNSERGQVRSESYQIAPMNVKIGVLNNVDFQLVLQPWTWLRIKNEATGAVDTDAGFGDITPRIKVNLTGDDGGFFALALIPFVKLPTAQNNLGNGAFEGGVGVPFAFDVPNWDVGFQTTVSGDQDITGSGHHAEIDDSVSIGHAVAGPLECHAEFFSGVSLESHSSWAGTVDT